MSMPVYPGEAVEDLTAGTNFGLRMKINCLSGIDIDMDIDIFIR